ncbi:hypothetical protein N9L19_00135 [bacterium]|nr:hypothetical protein [bacterium]
MTAAIRAAVAARGGRAVGGEDRLTEEVRDRLRPARGEAPGTGRQRRLLEWGLSPILAYLARALDPGEFDVWSGEDLGDATYEIYRIIVARTRIGGVYSGNLEDADFWMRLCTRLVAIRDGAAPERPEPFDGRGAEGRAWLARRPVAILGAALSATSHQVWHWTSSTGRDRARGILTLIGVLLLCCLWATMGPGLAFLAARFQEADDADTDGDSEAGTEATTASGAGAAADDVNPEVGQLRDELEALRARLPPVGALADDPAVAVGGATGRSEDRGGLVNSSGPVASQVSPGLAASGAYGHGDAHTEAASPTGQRVRMTADAPEFIPTGVGAPPLAWPGFDSPARPASHPAVSYAPFIEAGRVQMQSARILEALAHFERQRGADPWWFRPFWDWIDRAETADRFSHDVGVALRRGGWIGRGTVSNPPASLRQELLGLKDSGSPSQGAGGGAFVAATPAGLQAVGASNPITSGKLTSQLAPELRRAAREIYISCLAEGARSMREWVEGAFSSAKGSELWTDLWDRASQVDYELARFTNDKDLLAFLASNDIMEMHLRRLASKKYLVRTGDRSGAQHMLALQAPGQQSDVAPTWLVADATIHSKDEHQRAERVKAQRKGDDKGKGDSKGKGDKGKGKGKDKGAQGGGAALHA